MRRLAAVLVGFLALASLCHAAEADLPPYSGAVSLPAQPHTWTAEVSADFGALLRRLGEKAPLDPASVRVTAAPDQVLPTRFVPDPDAEDRGVVLWTASPLPKEAALAEFRVHFGPRSGRKWAAPDPAQVASANLLPNGGLEQADADGKRPSGWPLAGNLVRDAARAHSGDRCLRLDPRQDPKTGRWQSAMQTPFVNVRPGTGYGFRYWVRADGAVTGLVTAAQVYWYRADNSYIKHHGMGVTGEGTTQWQEVAAAFTAPPDSHHAMLTVSFYSPKGAAFLDDFTVLPTRRAQLDSAVSADGSRQAVLAAASAGVRRFDFGQDASAVWPGFTAATPASAYSKETGFGWVGADRPRVVVRALPDDLARDFVIAAAPCRFAVDLPDGDYAAWFLIGDNGLGDPIIPTHVNWRVSVGGQEALRYRPDAPTWYEKVVFRNYQDWWTPQVDVYDRFIAPQYAEHRAAFKVSGSQATFELQGVPLCALVIHPAGVEADVTEEITRLRADRRRSVTIRRAASAPEQPVGLTDDDRQRGYAVFSRPPDRDVLPESAPREGELTSRLSLAAAPGEREAASFALYPMRDLGEVSVSVTDLTSAEGGRIPAEAVQVGVVRYVERTHDPKEYRYEVLPGPIQPRNPMPAPAGTAIRWWLRVTVPESAAAGAYAGKVRVAPSQAPGYELDLALRVLPVRLGPTPITAGLYHFDNTYWYICWWRKCFQDADGWLRRQTMQHEEADFVLLKEYGLNSLAFCEDGRGDFMCSPAGELSTDPATNRFALWMDLYAKAGMGPMPWYGFTGACASDYMGTGNFGARLAHLSPEWRNAVRNIMAWARATQEARGWPEVLFYISDELSNQGEKGGELGRKLVEATRGVAGARIIASLNGPPESRMLPGLDIAMPNHAFPITEATIADIRRNRCEFWVYNIGNSRITWGLFLWRVGATGRFQWKHRVASNEPWNAFDGDNPYLVTWVTPDKPLPTTTLEVIREGLDDLRYVKALENAIAEARASGRPAAAQAADAAQAMLDRLRADIPEDPGYLIGKMDPREAGRPAVGRFADWKYLDELRLVMAEHIQRIQAAAGR